MEAKDVMTPDPACCTPDTMLEHVARKTVEHDCGEIPVVDNIATMVPVGVITDRDITCRTVAKGLNPLVMTVGDCMTTPPIMVTAETPLDVCCKVMKENRIRRIPVVDESGACIGIVSLADISKYGEREEISEVVREVSEPSASASTVD